MVVCGLCNAEVARSSSYIVNARMACSSCVATLQRELAAQTPGGTNFVVAVAGGLAGALVGAAVWAGVAIATGLEVGYVAVLVGFLTGLGVKFGAGKQRGPALRRRRIAAATYFGMLALYTALLQLIDPTLGSG